MSPLEAYHALAAVSRAAFHQSRGCAVGIASDPPGVGPGVGVLGSVDPPSVGEAPSDVPGFVSPGAKASPPLGADASGKAAADASSVVDELG